MVDKNLYYKKFAQVSVNDMIMSNTGECYKCKVNKQEFSVFIGEYQKLSSLYCCCCVDCLSTIIKKAIVIGRKDAEKQIKRDEDKKYQDSLNYVRKKKLVELTK